MGRYNVTLTKIKYILNEDGVWVLKDQIRIHTKEEHDVEEEEHVGSNDVLAAMFETPPTAFLLEKAFTSTWLSRMKIRLMHIKIHMRQIRETESHMRDTQTEIVEDLRDIKNMMAFLLFYYPPP
jgi:hypothetical protein